ncbi:MAG: nitric oxide reductase activation protein [Eubacteriales bacterium]|nr:nitric oxide reductase activation protein [Eubacteriales bacterium]
MSMNKEFEEEEFSDRQLEIENRCKNLLWTVSGDYSLNMKPDVSLFLRSREIALYDGIRRGAFAKYFSQEELSLYLLKKIYLVGEEPLLKTLATLCMEEAISGKVAIERPGVTSIRKKAFEDILDQEYEQMPSGGNIPDRLRVAYLSKGIAGCRREGDRKLKELLDLIEKAGTCSSTEELIEILDRLYLAVKSPREVWKREEFSKVLEVTIEQLAEERMDHFLEDEMYEELLESMIQQMNGNLVNLENTEITKQMEEKRKAKGKIIVLPEEEAAKAYSYVEVNFGKSYLSEAESRRMESMYCKGIHGDRHLYFTEGVLANPVRRNYQYEYARRLKNKNLTLYRQKFRTARRNIEELSGMLSKALLLRGESQILLSDRGMVVPNRLWRIGRSSDARVFQREIPGDTSELVVDILVDASGSQMHRQEKVALQAYMLSEALSQVGIPHRVMSYCTFWDYTVLHRFREYEDDRAANENIFHYVTSSNNRDGLAIRAVGHGLLKREEENKIMIILSDGRPLDDVVVRPGVVVKHPYQGQNALRDTASEIRKLRNAGVNVLGIFVGEEKELAAEKMIFGKDFAYIRKIEGFSKIVGRYLENLLMIEE